MIQRIAFTYYMSVTSKSSSKSSFHNERLILRIIEYLCLLQINLLSLYIIIECHNDELKILQLDYKTYNTYLFVA